MREQLADIVALKVLIDQAEGLQKAIKGGLELVPEDRLTAALGGRKIGTVSLTKGRVTAKTEDREAFGEWVVANHPDVPVKKVTIYEIPEWFEYQILEQAKKAGAAVDEETGESIPGITVTAGNPYVMVKAEKDALEVIGEAVRKGLYEVPVMRGELG